ncbi:MAG: AAA family ATPase [Rhodobacteraceae bacterium]|nr:AAA family ATPase [Paracoccaceae bacterium]
MYITTFYSFKGGVGRSMALANIAVGLSQMGKKVLVVDFDLEAPGLDTFDLLKPKGNPRGLVDYVLSYLETGKAPDASEYIHKSPRSNKEKNSIWIMPSGRNKAYESKVNLIDWIGLYENKDGYLLFEELKEQWRQKFNPDYVLIDSRTGHADTSGICTRQLPDSVVMLFFPNDQNLRGLTKVVEGINAESRKQNGRKIKLHFVMSNVPHLDDENQILTKKRMEFQRKLNITKAPLIVHRYDSLSLLNQELFLKTRPKSRLANEYRKLISEITMYNSSDPEGSIHFIKENRRPYSWRGAETQREIEKRLKEIEEKQKENGEVLYNLGELFDYQGDSEKALALFDQSITEGYTKPKAYFKRSGLHEEAGNREKAREDLLTILKSSLVSQEAFIIRKAIRQLINLGEFKPVEVVESPAVLSLNPEEKYWLVDGENQSKEQSQISVYLCKDLLNTDKLPKEISENSIKFDLGLSLMALGNCNEARSNFEFIIESNPQDEFELLASHFNLAMANWEKSKIKRNGYFQKVVDLHEADKEQMYSPNHFQCMTLAYWGIGDIDNSLYFLRKARNEISSVKSRLEFSCWRYLRVNKQKFMEDLDEIEMLMSSPKSVKPKFLVRQTRP